jgi:hypothetical protein
MLLSRRSFRKKWLFGCDALMHAVFMRSVKSPSRGHQIVYHQRMHRMLKSLSRNTDLLIHIFVKIIEKCTASFCPFDCAKHCMFTWERRITHQYTYKF